MQNQLAGKSVKQKCFDVLKDLETTYIDLSTGHKWNVTRQSTSVFPASADLTKEIYALAAGKDRIPYEEWLKDCTCHNCGIKGHIPSKCPTKPKDGHQTRDMKNRRPYENKRYDRGGRGDRDRRGQTKQDNRKSKRDQRFKKAYKAAIETYARDSSSEEDSDTSASPRENVSDSGNNSDGSDCSLAAHAARMFKSLKD